MSMRKSVLAGMLMATLAAAIPTASQAQRWDRGYDRHDRYDRRYDDRRYDDRRYYDRRASYRGERRGCRSGGTTGLLLGGAAGALLGRSIDTRGDRAPGTIIGAGAGALLGREVERGSRC